MKLSKPRRRNVDRQESKQSLHHKSVLELLEDRRMLAAVSWTGGGDGQLWQDPANWSNQLVPGAADDVTIDVAADPFIDIAGRSVEVNSLLSNERLELRTSLRVTTLADVSDISLNRGALAADRLTIRGDATLEISTLNIGTAGTFQNTANIEFIGSANNLTGDFVNAGIMTLKNAAVRQQDATISNSTTGTILFENSSLSSGQLINEGKIISSGDSLIGATLDNRSTINLTGERLRLRRGNSKVGIEVPDGATIEFGSNFEFTGEIGVVGRGSVSFTNGRHEFGDAAFDVRGAVSISGGSTVNFDSNVEFASLNVDRGSITGLGSMTILGDSSFNLARPIDIDGSFTVHDSLTVQGSTVQANGGVFVRPGAELEIRNFESTVGPVIVNQGNISLINSVTKLDKGTLTNTADASISFVNATIGSGTLINEGILLSSGESAIQSDLQNDGSIHIDNGQLTVGGGSSSRPIEVPANTALRFRAKTFSLQGAADLTGTGTIELQAATLQSEQPLVLRDGASLVGHGTVVGDVNNITGVVSPGTADGRGKLTIHGNYSQGAGSAFEINLFGIGTFDNDLLAVSGNVTAEGSVDVFVNEGFVPTAGDEFSVVEAGTLAQAFSNATSNNLDVAFSPRRNGNIVELVASAATGGDQAESIRRLLNQSLEVQRSRLPDVSMALDQPSGNLPFAPEDAGGLGSALAIGPAIASLANGVLPFANIPITGFSQLKAQLEQLGYSVECVFGEEVCDGDFIRMRSVASAELSPVSFDVTSWLGNPLEELISTASADGTTTVSGRLETDLIFGIDDVGFFLASESEVRTIATLEANLTGDVGPFSLHAEGQISVSPKIQLGAMDSDGDGRIRLAEFDATRITADLGEVTGNATLALEITTLDYVDVLPGQANTTHGGDPFKLVASGSVQANVGQLDASVWQRVSANWSGIEIANPDIDANNTPDFTSDVLADNLRLFAVSQLRGSTEGFLGPLTETLNEVNLIGTNTPLGEALQLQTSLADFVEDRIDVAVIGFDAIETWINTGNLPEETELVELTLDLGDISLIPATGLSVELPFTLGEDAPPADIAFDQATLAGQLVIGVDLTGDQPYIKTSPLNEADGDEFTSISGSFGFSASLSELSIGDELLRIESPKLAFATDFGITFNGGDNGKLPIAELIDPQAIQATFGTNSVLELTADDAIVQTGNIAVSIRDDDTNDEVSAVLGTVDIDSGQVTLALRTVEASIGGFLNLEASSNNGAAAVEFSYSPQAKPEQPLFTVQELVGTSPLLTANGLTPSVTFSQFGIQHDGSPFVGDASLEIPDGYRVAAGLAGLIPVEINRVDLSFPDRNNIDQFDVIVAGTVLVDEVDEQLDSLLKSDVTTTLRIGDAADNEDQFAALLSVESLSEGNLAAATIGQLVEVGNGEDRRTIVEPQPITLGINDFELADGLTLGGELRIDPLANGELGSEVTGHFDVLSVDPALASSNFTGLRLDILPGSVATLQGDSLSLNVNGRLQLDANFTGTLGGIGVSGGAVRFSITGETTTLDTLPFVRFDLFTASIDSVTADEIVVNIGELVRVTASDIAVVENPAAGQPIGSINRVGVEVFAFGNWHSDFVTAEDVQIFENRIEFNELSATLAGEISTGDNNLASFENLEINLSGLTVATASNPLDGGDFSLSDLDAEVDAIRITADRANFFDGVATLSDVTASIGLDESQKLGVTLTAEQFDATLEDVVDLSSTDVTISISDDPTADVLSIGTISGTIAALTGDVETFSVSAGLAVRGDGAMRFLSNEVEASLNIGQFVDRLSIADVLPVTVEEAAIKFNSALTDLSDFDVILTDIRLEDHFVDSLPFEPILLIEDPDDPAPQNDSFDLTIAFSSRNGDVPRAHLKDVGPITLGFQDWDVGEVVFDGEINFGGIDSDGRLLPFSADNDIAGSIEFDFENPGGTIRPSEKADDPLVVNGGSLAIGGSYSAATENRGARIELDVQAGLDFDLRLGELFQLKDVDLNSSIVFNFESPGDLIPNVDFSLNQVSFTEFEMNFGELMTAFGSGPQFNLSPTDEQPLIAHFDTLEVRFPAFSDENAQEPLGGTVSNLDINKNGEFAIGGVQIAGGGLEGVLQWLPINISEVGLEFGDDFFCAEDNCTQIVNDPTDIQFLLSGEVEKLSIGEGDNEVSLPFYGDFTNLTVDVGDFLDGNFPITDFESFTVGLEPIPLAEGFKIGGEIGLGIVEITTDGKTRKSIYGSLKGEFDTPLFGGSAKLILSEVGPLFGELTVPLAIPLGPSGLILKDARGGFRFGGEEIGSVDSPSQLIETDRFVEFLDVGPTPEIAAELERVLQSDIDFTWQLPFTMGVSGTVDSALSPGVFQGDLSLAAQFGSESDPTLKLLGTGEINVYGMPFGRAGVLLDFAGFADPKSDTFLAPKLDFAFRSPAPGNPLGFLLPAEVVFEGALRTDGMIEAPLIAVRHFLDVALNEIRDGLSTSEFSIATAVLDSMAAKLTPESPLMRRLFDDPTTEDNETQKLVVSGEALGEAIMAELPPSFFNGLDNLPELVELATLVLRDALQAIDGVDVRFGDLQTTYTAFMRLLKDAVPSAVTVAMQQFNPTLEINGALQPTIFGFPLGTATDEVNLAVSKDGVAFGLTTSIKESLKRSAGLFGTAVAAGFTDLFVGGPGFTDELSFDISLDFPTELISAIFDGEETSGVDLLDTLVDTINPLANWEGSVEGAVKFFGLDIAKVSGIVFSRQDEIDTTSLFSTKVHNVGLADDVALNAENSGAPLDKIPVFRQSQYDAMSDLGGILLTGELNIPAILQDPVAVFRRIESMGLPDISEQLGTLDDNKIDLEDLTAVTAIKDDYTVYVTGVINALTANARAGSVQLYVPSPQTLLDVNLLLDENGSFNPSLIPDSSAQLVKIVESAYLEGFVDLKLLSVDVGGVQVEGNARGLTASMQNAFLAGLDAEMQLGTSTLTTADLVNSVLNNPLVATAIDSIPLPPGVELDPTAIPRLLETLAGDEITIPVASVFATIGTNSLLSQLEIPKTAINAAANASIEFYSPGFDLDSPHPTADPNSIYFRDDQPVKLTDDVKRFGGGRFVADLDMTRLVDNARFLFEVEMPFVDIANLSLPNFVAYAEADRIGLPSPDLIEMDEPKFELVGNNEGITLEIGADLRLLGDRFTSSVDGQLGIRSGQFVGELLLESDIDLGAALKIDGSARVAIDTSENGQTEVIVSGTDETGDATLELFSSTSGLRPFGVDAAGEFVFRASDDDLLLDFEADAEMIVLNAVVGSGKVDGLLEINDRVTGTFDGELTVFPYGKSETHIELDAFGCFSFESTGIPLSPFEVGNCGTTLTVASQISSLDSRLTLQLNEPAERDLDTRLRISDGTRAAEVLFRISANQRFGSVVLPAQFQPDIDRDVTESLDVSILTANYISAGIDLFRPADPRFSPLAEQVKVVYPSIQVAISTNIATQRVGDDLEGRVKENAEPIVVTFSATSDTPLPTGSTITVGWSDSLRADAKTGEDFETSHDSVTFRIGEGFSESFTITPTDDSIFEPHERLALSFRVDDSPSPKNTYVPVRRLGITLEDNDAELPSDTLAFYAFDKTRFEVASRDGSKSIDGCCFPELSATYVADDLVASDFQRGNVFRTNFNGTTGPPILSKGPADLSPQGIEKHDPVFSAFSHAAVEENWTNSIADTSFYEFAIRPQASKTVAVTGIDFWERRVLENLPVNLLVGSPESGFVNGPTKWEIRSSRDDFATALVEGDTFGSRFKHQVAAFDSPFLVAPNEEVSFRIYGLENRSDDFDKIPWVVDNVALIGTTGSTPINTRPKAFDPPRINIPRGTLTPIQIPLQGFDVETAAGDLTFEVSTPPAIGSVVIEGDEALFTPPAGGLNAGVSFQYVVRDRGTGDFGSAKSSPAIVEIATTSFDRPKLEFLKGKVVKNYVAGGTVFLDANQNGALDFLDSNGNGLRDADELLEPSALTKADGSYELFVSTDFDKNNDGQLTAADGLLTILEGTIVGSEIPLSIPLQATPQNGTITPMTTVVAQLVNNSELDFDVAEQLVADRFTGGSLLPSETDPVKEAINGNTNAKQAEAASVALMTSVEIATAVLSSTDQGNRLVRNKVLAHFAELLVTGELTVPFQDAAPFAKLLEDTASENGTSLSRTIIAVAAETIAQVNAKADEAAQLVSKSTLVSLAKVEKDTRDVIVPLLKKFVQGEGDANSIAIVLDEANYNERLAATSVGAIQPVAISIEDAVVVESDVTNFSVSVAVQLSEPTLSEISVSYETVTDSATDDDFTSSAGTLTFEPGETRKTIRITIKGDLRKESTELFRIRLSDATGAVITDRFAAIEIDDNDPNQAERSVEFIDSAVAAITSQSDELEFDFDNDGKLSDKDFDVLVDDLLQVQRGDTNLDGQVDFADFLVLAGNFGKQSGWGRGSFDLNGEADFGDFLALAANFGREE